MVISPYTSAAARGGGSVGDAAVTAISALLSALGLVLCCLVITGSGVCHASPAVTVSEPMALYTCDVVIAGGSLASAAAAIAASEASSSNTTRVCFLEITDWPGGQATAGGIVAMDFGLQYLNFPHNVPKSLAQLLTAGKMGGPTYNPGECQYLPKCFPPKWVASLILDRLRAAPNVAVFLNTTVVGVDRDAVTGRIVALRAVQRTPTREHPTGWDRPLSQALPDWYSSRPSPYFDKVPLQFEVAPTGVVVEATEFGDVLMLADGVAVGQGVEVNLENSTKYDDHCPNPAALTVFAEWGTSPLPPPADAAGAAGAPATAAAAAAANMPEFLVVRRYWTNANHTPRVYNPYHASNKDYVPPLAPGDHYTVTSGCNDLTNANVLLPMPVARATARAGTWVGGMNLTAIAKAEAQTWACFRAANADGALLTRPKEAGTSSGISKMLYLREGRRSMRGVGAFRLCHNVMSADNTGPGGAGCSDATDIPQHGGNGTGYRFHDTVALASPQPMFGFDVHRPKWCKFPPYMSDKMRIPNSTVAFYIPFRALTVANASNLLVAGKCMATSFLANAVTRLHPNEWSSGTAAGAAAALMSAHNITSGQLAADVSQLQDSLRALGAPLVFNLTETDY